MERFSGFGTSYDAVRPSAPSDLADFLSGIARCGTPPRVVDLGAGTGLSTRYWIDRASSVIGVEPADSMREVAQAVGGERVTYNAGSSHCTGLPGRSADIVVAAQALHWMDPDATFAEAARLLRSGGVFAAYDYDWPPATSRWRADLEYERAMKQARELESELGIAREVPQWDKEGHLRRMRASGQFRYVRESLLHHRDKGGADRLVGLLLSQGYVQALLKRGVPEEELGVVRLRRVAEAEFGDAATDWFWSARIRLGVV